MGLDTKTKIKLAETYVHITEGELCRRMGVTQQAWCQRMKNCKFSDADMEMIGKALGAKVTLKIEFPDGTVFE